MLTSNERVCMGFDFGTKKIGVAIGQTITQTASALELVKVKNNQIDWPHLDKLVASWRPSELIVGWSVHMDGSKSEITVKIERFINQLQARYNLACHKVDERLTTFEAKQLLRDSKEKIDCAIDSVAAVIIVRNWLEQQG
jgi:putative holliday junction resolvase